MGTYSIKQTTQINEPNSPFQFTEQVEVIALAPLATAQLNSGNNAVIVKATLFIDSNDQETPGILSINESDNILEIVFDYNFPEEIPEAYNVWYVELEYPVGSAGEITTVITRLRDLDPTTSRGTVTTVQPAG